MISANAQAEKKRVIRGVVFDMDGTLTVPVIDFAEMRRRVGVPDGIDILFYIDSIDADQKQLALSKIAEIEEDALQRMKIMPGTKELCSLLDSKQIPRALVTRNVSASVDFFHRSHFNLPPFFPALSREWTPYKPDPAALHHIADQWGVQSEELVMIGDSAKDDIVCGNRAGAVSILLDIHGTYSGMEDPKLAGEMKPDFIVKSLKDIADLFMTTEIFELKPATYPDAAAGGGGSDS